MQEVNLNELKKCLEISRLALSDQDFVPIMNHLCFDGNYIITCNNTDTIINPFESDLDCGVPGELFFKFISTIEKQPEFSVLDNDLHIKAGRSKIKIPTLSKENFIEDIKEFSNVCCTAMCTKEFLEGLKLCLLTINDTPNQFQDNGVYLQNGCLFSTNGACVSRYKSGLEIELGEQPFILIPTSFCRNLLKIVEKLGVNGIEISIGETFISATFPNGIVSASKIIDTQTFALRDFEKVISEYSKSDIEEVQFPESFNICLKRIMLLYDKIDQKKMNVSITKSSIGSDVVLHCKTGLGEIKETFSIRKRLEERSFLVNPELLLKGYKSEFSIDFCKKCLVLKQGLYIQLVCYIIGE